MSRSGAACTDGVGGNRAKSGRALRSAGVRNGLAQAMDLKFGLSLSRPPRSEAGRRVWVMGLEKDRCCSCTGAELKRGDCPVAPATSLSLQGRGRTGVWTEALIKHDLYFGKH